MYKYLLSVLLLTGILTLCVAQDTQSAAGNAASDCITSPVEYDYIVVGLGQAGSVVAARLAESGKYKVLGIEAGGRTHRSLNGTDYVAPSYSKDSEGNVVLNTPFTRFDVPLFYPSTYTSPTPYVNYPVYKNGTLTTSFVAKLLGGSGAHNGMIWSRVTSKTVDGWGVSGWSYNDVLPFYKKSEDVTGTRGELFASHHGLSGPIKITDVPEGPFFSSVPYFLAACNNTGLPRNLDLNGPTRLGCGTHQFNIRRGVRDSAAQAYLPNALKKGNLLLALEAFANRVVFEKVNGTYKAVAVEYKHKNVTIRVKAKKEIVLCLSAVLTPKILQLSGIGPAALLAKFNIPLIYNNSYVGRNLGNNQITSGKWANPNGTIPNGWRISDYTSEYALNGTGPLAFTGSFGFAYACSKETCDDPDTMIGTSAGVYAAGTTVPTINTNVEAAFPLSRGVITISSADPAAPPNLDMPTFQNPADINATIYGFQLLRKIRNTPPADTFFGPELVPGPSVQTYQDYYNFVTKNGIPTAHWFGTTKVGNSNDPTAVVDNRLRVKGVKGLRVGDTSIIPQMNSHSSATAVMVGERVSDFMLADAYSL